MQSGYKIYSFLDEKLCIYNDKTLGDFFLSVLALVNRVTWYLLLVGGDKYPVELIEVCRPDTTIIRKDKIIMHSQSTKITIKKD